MKRFLEFPGLTVLGILLTILLTWPLIININTYYPDTTEYVFNGWIMWYNQHSFLTGRIFDQLSYFSSNQFYPFPFSLAYSEHLFIPSMIFALVYWISKDLAFSVNYFNILTFVFTFISSYYCIKFFVKGAFSSLIGAFVFTFNPITFTQFFGHHTQLMNKYFIPPLFLFAYLYIKVPTWKRSFYFYTFFTLNALSSIYFQTFSLILIPIFWLPFLFDHLIKKNFRFYANFMKTNLILLIFLPVLYYFNYPYLQFSNLEGASRNLHENAVFSARGIDWISSFRTNLLYGKFVQGLHLFREPKDPNNSFNYTEHTLFLNLIPSLFFLIGAISLRFNKVSWALILVLIFSATFTFGPYFYGWNSKESLIVLPYERIYRFLYFLHGIRVPTRIQFFFYIPFALIVSFGVDKLLKYSGKKSIFIFCAIGFFLILENINLVNFDSKSQIFPYLASENIQKSSLIAILKEKNTVHYPIFTADIGNNIRYLNWSTVTLENIFNGYSGYFPPDWSTLAFNTKIDSKSLEKFYLLGIDYLIIHKNLLNPREIKDYYDNLDFLKMEISFNDREITVIDLKKINLNPPICYLRDMRFEINTKTYPVAQSLGVSFQLFPKITLVNPKNCYVINKNYDRYSRIELTLQGEKQSISIKLPVLIEPYEELLIY